MCHCWDTFVHMCNVTLRAFLQTKINSKCYLEDYNTAWDIYSSSAGTLLYAIFHRLPETMIGNNGWYPVVELHWHSRNEVIGSCRLPVIEVPFFNFRVHAVSTQ